jgi:hypothetical protein
MGGRAASGPVVLPYRNLVVATGDADEEPHLVCPWKPEPPTTNNGCMAKRTSASCYRAAKVLSSSGPLLKKKGKAALRFAHWILPSVLHMTAHFSATRSQHRQAAAETYINSARLLRKADREPDETYLVLITDLYEGGDAKFDACACRREQAMRPKPDRAASAFRSGRPAYEAKRAEAIASLECPVFACTPDVGQPKHISLSSADLEHHVRKVQR